MVTPTEKARRSEALYYDNHNITRRTLCDRIVNLESDMEEVKAENDKLREENERFIIKLNAEHIVRQNVEAENAKLRELAEKAWKAAEMLCQAWDGPCRADGVSIMSPCPMDERDELCVYGLIQRDLRELGVEVDR